LRIADDEVLGDVEVESDRPSIPGSSSKGGDDNLDFRYADSMNIEWYKEDNLWLTRRFAKKNRPAFVSEYFVAKEVREDSAEYVNGSTYFEEGLPVNCIGCVAKGADVYPPMTFNRRVTTNTWQTLLALAMLEAGLRLVSLQANLKLAVELFFEEQYDMVPMETKILFAGFFFAGILFWAMFGAYTAYSYRAFLHPDSRYNKFLAFSSSALLSMFAIPNDLVLMTIHYSPQRSGGLLVESTCVEGNKRWPVHSMAHYCKADHDYTNWSGSKVQLPLFVMIDVCCSFIVIYLAFVGILNVTTIFQMGSTFLYAFYRVYGWSVRWSIRGRLFFIWLETCCDPHVPQQRRRNVVAKYIAEGGDRQLLRDRLAQAGLSDIDVPNSRKSVFSRQIGLGRTSGKQSKK